MRARAARPGAPLLNASTRRRTIEDGSDWADVQADLSLRWSHTHFVGFVMSWHINDNDNEPQQTCSPGNSHRDS